MTTLKFRYDAVRNGVEIADVGFFLLRVVALAGAVAWLLVAQVPPETVSTFLRILAFFAVYGLLIYALLFIRFDRKRDIYRLSFLFDLVFVCLLVVYSGGFASSFFIGFYLLTALHAFYFGWVSGLVSAAVCAAVYYSAGVRVSEPELADYLLKASFLFLIAMPIGLLSGVLRRDKEKIEWLNEDLRRSLERMTLLQKKLMEVEKLSALGRLTADVAHEIRNPLTVIGGFAKRLEDRLGEDTKEKRYAHIVVSEVARLERILRDTLIFSRDARVHFRYADMNELLVRTAMDYEEVCREKGIDLSVLPGPGPPQCIVDDDQIRMALGNLVTNAVDAESGGGTLTLATRTECENGVNYVVIDVVDSGHGVPPDIIDRIFEPFYSTKGVGYGTGLGLSICRKIMEEHRGSARVSSTPGKGSVFSLLIPYIPTEDAFKAQCWEVMRCGVEAIDPVGKRCTAYPNFGRICWSVAGTMADTKVQCVVAEKIGDCRKCPFYEIVQQAGPG